ACALPISQLARRGEDAAVAAVGMHGAGKDAGLVVGAQDDRAGAVAEQHAGRAVLPVENARQRLGADHQRRARLPGADEAVRYGQRVNEAAAYRLHVESHCALVAEALLQQAGGAGKHLVGGGRGDDDEIEVLGPHARSFQRLLARFESKIAGVLALLGEVALADTRTRRDPLIRGVDGLGKVVIGDEACGQIAAGADNAGVGHVVSGTAKRCVIRARASLRTSSVARSSARANAKASAEPWLFTTMPRRPSKEAPL